MIVPPSPTTKTSSAPTAWTAYRSVVAGIGGCSVHHWSAGHRGPTGPSVGGSTAPSSGPPSPSVPGGASTPALGSPPSHAPEASAATASAAPENRRITGPG